MKLFPRSLRNQSFQENLISTGQNFFLVCGVICWWILETWYMLAWIPTAQCLSSFSLLCCMLWLPACCFQFVFVKIYIPFPLALEEFLVVWLFLYVGKLSILNYLCRNVFILGPGLQVIGQNAISVFYLSLNDYHAFEAKTSSETNLPFAAILLVFPWTSNVRRNDEYCLSGWLYSSFVLLYRES